MQKLFDFVLRLLHALHLQLPTVDAAALQPLASGQGISSKHARLQSLLLASVCCFAAFHVIFPVY